MLRNTADFALLGVLKIFYYLSSESSIDEYSRHPRIVKRMPNYRVSLGFGMHYGWAYEGTIGSEFKIDATYLS